MASDIPADEFETLSDALRSWPVHKDRPEVWPEIEAVIDKVKDELGPVVRIHIPSGQPYIGVTFSKEPSKIGAYVGAGRIDHIVEVAGSYIPDAAPAYWRSELSTVGTSSSSSRESSESEFVKCPNGCGYQIKVTAECGCGWKYGQ